MKNMPICTSRAASKQPEKVSGTLKQSLPGLMAVACDYYL